MNENDISKRERLHAEDKKVLEESRLSNSQIYDRAILTLSTSALGLSIVFLKFIVPIREARWTELLITSWCLFGAAIITTIISFLASQKGIERQLHYNYKYYIEGEDEYLNKVNWGAKLTNILNYVSGFFFILAIGATIWFVSINVLGDTKVTEKTVHNINEGAPISRAQRVQGDVIERGAPISRPQPVQGTQNQSGTEQSSGQSQSSSGTGSDSGQSSSQNQSGSS